MSTPVFDNEVSVWRSGYAMGLLALFLFGVSLIVIGAGLFIQGSLLNVVLIGTGISLAPASVVAALFRVFLFKEVKYQLTGPVIDVVKERLGPEIRHEVHEMAENYRREIATLQSLRDAGMISPYRSRTSAMKEFASAVDAETTEIMVIGSSLRGLLQKEDYREIAEKLHFKIGRGGVAVRFLLTHPVVADFRAGQEARRNTEIGQEIIESLCKLKDWNVPPENVRLYKGTPTCFAIKTKSKMFLNFYPYGAQALDSPCLIVETSDQHPSYFYDKFAEAHFGAWETNFAIKISNYDETIGELRGKLGIYADAVTKLLNL